MTDALRSRRIPFAVASGRTYPALKRIFAPYAGALLLLPLDGAFALAGDTLLCAFPLQENVIEEARHMAEEAYPGIRGVEFCTLHHSYLITRDPALTASEQIRIGDELIAGTPPPPGEAVGKIIFFSRRGHAPRCLPPGLRAVYTSDTVTECVREDVSKLKAAETLCESLHISLSEVLAYGDSENDRELLSRAGRAVTIYGAKHDIFSMTPYHTQNVAESVLHLLRRAEAEDAERNQKQKRYGKV